MTTRDSMRALVIAALLGVALTGCDDLLNVSDPQRYTSDDLDTSLDAVANGVEGDLYAGLDNYQIYTALNSDEYQHTGTWIGYDNYDHGRFFYGNASGGGGGDSSDGIMNDLLQVRAFALQAQERFDRVLGDASASSPLTARVRTVEAWADLLLAQSFCEAPAVPSGPAVSDVALYEQAVDKLTAAMQSAAAAGLADVELWARAGRARAHLMLGNYAEALADADAVPTDFVWLALFSENSGRQESALVNLTTTGFNAAASVREKWWPRVDTDAGMMLDPWTDEPDPRLPVRYTGELGGDGLTPHYSQWKYQTRGADVAITDGREMRLIEAEVHWRNGELPEAVAILDALRADVGLGALPPSNDADVVFDYLLHERFAELFLEGHRMNDLHRFGLVAEFIANGSFGSNSESPRPTKFPLSEDEAVNNPNIEDSVSARCLPMSG